MKKFLVGGACAPLCPALATPLTITALVNVIMIFVKIWLTRYIHYQCIKVHDNNSNYRIAGIFCMKCIFA